MLERDCQDRATSRGTISRCVPRGGVAGPVRLHSSMRQRAPRRGGAHGTKRESAGAGWRRASVGRRIASASRLAVSRPRPRGSLTRNRANQRADAAGSRAARRRSARARRSPSVSNASPTREEPARQHPWARTERQMSARWSPSFHSQLRLIVRAVTRLIPGVSSRAP